MTVHTSKYIRGATLEVAQPAPVPSPEDGTFHQSPQFMLPDVEETRTLQPISSSTRHHKKRNDTSLPSTRSLQKFKSKLSASKAKPDASGLFKKKCMDTSPKCGTSGTQKNKHVDRRPKPGLQGNNQPEVRHQKK